MRREKFSTERTIRNFVSVEDVEMRVNEMIREFFRKLMQLNMVAEGDTLRFDIDENEKERITFNGTKKKEKDVMIKLTCMMREAKSRNYDPDAIYKNGRNTTVKWEDGTVTTVKLAEGEEDCDYTAFTAALARKIYGTNSRVKKIMEKKTVLQKKKEKKAMKTEEDEK